MHTKGFLNLSLVFKKIYWDYTIMLWKMKMKPKWKVNFLLVRTPDFHFDLAGRCKQPEAVGESGVTDLRGI